MGTKGGAQTTAWGEEQWPGLEDSLLLSKLCCSVWQHCWKATERAAFLSQAGCSSSCGGGEEEQDRAEAFPPGHLQSKINSDDGNNDFLFLFLLFHS